MKKVYEGARFFRLLVLEKVAPRFWKVKCDCGKFKIVRGGNLLRSTKSCGCWRKEISFDRDTSGVPVGVSAKRYKLSQYKKGARDRNLPWDLSDTQAYGLMADSCFYCGLKPSQVVTNKYGKGDFIYNGIDRVDNSRGYETDNVVTCCKTCNRAKDVMTKEDFISWAIRVARYGERRIK
jgi:hypothetical protein